MSEGRIYVIEGSGDRVGKETQSKLLAEYLEKIGHKVKRVSFPVYDDSSSLPVRHYLNGDLGKELTSEEIAALFAFDRSVTTRKLNVREELKNGTDFVFDRYTESNLIYQVAKNHPYDGLPLNESDKALILKLRQLEGWYFNIPLPNPEDIFFLHLKWEINERLLKKDLGENIEKGDIHEQNIEYLMNVSSMSTFLACDQGWNIIECGKDNELLSIEEIHDKIVAVLKVNE